MFSADDDDEFGAGLKQALVARGYEAREPNDGATALELLAISRSTAAGASSRLRSRPGTSVNRLSVAAAPSRTASADFIRHLATTMTSGRKLTEWELCYDGWNPQDQPLRESLTTLGNGYFATRGAGEEARADGPNYPGTYLAGGYNRLESTVAGRVVENEDLVNWPNWLPLSFRVEGGEWFDLERVEIRTYKQWLDLRRGVLSRRIHFRDRAGRESILESRRIVHMANVHVGALEWVLTPVNWSGRIEVRSALDGRVTNRGVARYRGLEGRHLEILETGSSEEDAVYLVSRTNQSHRVMAQAKRTQPFFGDLLAPSERRIEAEPQSIAQHLHVSCVAGSPLRVEDVMSLYTGEDFAVSEPRLEACGELRSLPAFADLLRTHERAWRHVWHRADLEISGCGAYPQLVLRLHIFHLLQTVVHAIDADVGLPARGLHGEAYRGHIFWDELFTFPFLNLRIPELTRSLLMYRYRRMNQAREAAREAGYRGAMFPWQSGSNGREETQVVHLNPDSGRWIPDRTQRQRHVNAAIAYNVWQYHQATGDTEFLSFYGAEMLLELARFWASICTYDSGRGRYVINGVVGPDEFHTEYPGSDRPGIDNNAYTNVMAAWVLRKARAALRLVAEDRSHELRETLELTDEELRHWDSIAGSMYVPFRADGIILQFDGWESLEELDWEGLRARHKNIYRLDRILRAAGDDPNRYKATKQADVLMLFFLLSAEELREHFEHMGYKLPGHLLPRTVDYYLARTSHGSTLSRVVHAWVLSRTRRAESWHLFRDALGSDIDDAQGGTTAEGVHLGAMSGTVDLMQRCYTGIEVREDVLWLNPLLPKELTRLSFRIRYRGHWLRLGITQSQLTVAFEQSRSPPARIAFRGEIHEMGSGAERTFVLPARGEAK